MVANNAIEGLPIDVNIYSHPTIKNKNSEDVNYTLTIYNYEEDIIELCIQFWVECNIIDEIIKNIMVK